MHYNVNLYKYLRENDINNITKNDIFYIGFYNENNKK